jgi:hypothetical protein
LEPSAWLGNIFGNFPFISNKCKFIELDKLKFDEMCLRFWDYPIDMWEWDFLEFTWETFDKIIANPPFSKSQDVKHILHMYELLKNWWRIVSVASSSIQHREWKLYDELRALKPEFIELPEWSFKKSW